MFLQLHYACLVLDPKGVDLLLGIGVHLLQQLPLLRHLCLPLPVDVQLRLGARLGLSETLGERDDLGRW